MIVMMVKLVFQLSHVIPKLMKQIHFTSDVSLPILLQRNVAMVADSHDNQTPNALEQNMFPVVNCIDEDAANDKFNWN